jgi:ABC-2 type transport system permease protein
MTATTAPTGTAGRTTTSAFSRIYGLGSVYAKTLRDSRLALIIMCGLIGAFLLSSGIAFGEAYTTVESRLELKALVGALPPAMAGVYGNPFPTAIETLGGSIAWKTAASLGLMAALWSVLALSGTIASEVRRGSIEFVATTPLGKRRIALEKLAAHVTGMAIVVLATTVCAYVAGTFGTLPGDAISWASAFGFGVWIGVVALASGSIAFALAPFVGRGASAAIAGAVLLFGYFANGYQDAAPAFAPFANLTWWGWTVHHQPLVGNFDWVALVPAMVLTIALLTVGVVAFARRDLGAVSRIPWPRMPAFALGLGGPFSRSLGERLPLAFWWGIGIGLMGFVFGAAAPSFAATLKDLSPDTLNIFKAAFPQIDLLSGAGAFLQLAFITFGLILAGFATATLVKGWASDETEGRLEVLLSTPMSRAKWALRGGLGLYAAIGVMTLVVMLAIGLGSLSAGGSEVATPIVGTLVLGLYSLALAGIGIAFGGLVSTAFAGEIIALLVILTFVIDTVVPALKWPDWIQQLALTAHLGHPMVGLWDWPGMGLLAAIALGGLLLGTWGVNRRDVQR